MIGRPSMPADAVGRLRAARALFAAGVLCRKDDHDVAAANAVLSGIAASDVLTCLRLHRMADRGDRSDALALLAQCGDEGTRAARVLSPLLALRKRPHGSRMTVGEARQALERARWLVDLAEQVALGPEAAPPGTATPSGPRARPRASVRSPHRVSQSAHPEGVQVLR